MSADRRRRRASLTDRAAAYFVTRSSIGRRMAVFTGELRQRRVPLHWTNMFGVVSMACVVVLFATGLFLMFLYTPSGAPVVYRGGYLPLHGTTMSKALSSTLAISL